ncbi:MAG: type II toxin-antitoxin system death-on-curing family toxin [Woeseia sp.]
MKSQAGALQNDGIQFLSVEEATAIQERLIERFGGSPGIRGKGLLESALFRPQTGYYRDIPEMTAALFESLLLSHAFVDENKRVAFPVTDTFLRLNGWKLSVEPAAAYDFIIGILESGHSRYDKLLRWIRQSLRKTK